MKGEHEVKVFNRRVQYRFTLRRNLTILRGDSATGKTTMIDMIQAYQTGGANSGITLLSDKPCVVLTSLNWQMILSQIRDSIVFIDEGDSFVASRDFARAVEISDNYYVIATRASLFNLPYSIMEVYGIRNKSGNRYQGTKRIYSEFVSLYKDATIEPRKPDVVVVENSNSGFDFFSHVCRKHGICCISAQGKSNVYGVVNALKDERALVIADGAAFGPEMERVLSLSRARELSLYLPESFEWMILRSGLIESVNVREVLAGPAAWIESRDYFSWERFFTDLLVRETQGTYQQYGKKALNPVYLQPHEAESIMRDAPVILD